MRKPGVNVPIAQGSIHRGVISTVVEVLNERRERYTEVKVLELDLAARNALLDYMIV